MACLLEKQYNLECVSAQNIVTTAAMLALVEEETPRGTVLGNVGHIINSITDFLRPLAVTYMHHKDVFEQQAPRWENSMRAVR